MFERGPSMKILLLGGTGAMGSHLIDVLTDRGDTVIVTSRSCNVSKGLVEYRQGNAKSIIFLNEIMKEQWDVIVDFMIYSEDEFRERLDLLLDFTSQYIFLSSARVYDGNQEELTESSARLLDSSIDYEFLSTKDYSLSKARQEDMLLSSNKRKWTIVRPYITYSEKRLQLGTLEKEDWLYRALKGRTIIFSKDINNHLTTLTYGLDVANGIANLINKPESLGEVYHITSGYEYKWSEILEIYLDVIEKRIGFRPSVIYQDLPDFLTWNPAKYQILYDRLFDRRFNCTKINNIINTEEFVDLQSGLRKCLNDFLDNPEFIRVNWKKEAQKDRFVNEKAALKEIIGIKQKFKYLVYRYFNMSRINSLFERMKV